MSTIVTDVSIAVDGSDVTLTVTKQTVHGDASGSAIPVGNAEVVETTVTVG